MTMMMTVLASDDGNDEQAWWLAKIPGWIDGDHHHSEHATFFSPFVGQQSTWFRPVLN